MWFQARTGPGKFPSNFDSGTPIFYLVRASYLVPRLSKRRGRGVPAPLLSGKRVLGTRLAISLNMYVGSIFSVLLEIAEAHDDLKLTITESTKGAMAMGGSTSAGAMAGGLLGGPPGMIVGGLVGFVFGANYASSNAEKFKPLWQVLKDMSKEEQTKLVKAAKKVIQQKGIDLANDIAWRCGSSFARNFLISVYEEFSGKKLQ